MTESDTQELEMLRAGLEILADPCSWVPSPNAIPVKVHSIARYLLNVRYHLQITHQPTSERG